MLSQVESISLSYDTVPYVRIMKGQQCCGVMANVLDCGLEVIEFELQSGYNVYFWSNILGKGMNSFIPAIMG